MDTATPAFDTGAEDSNSGPHAGVADTPPTQSLLSPRWLNLPVLRTLLGHTRRLLELHLLCGVSSDLGLHRSLFYPETGPGFPGRPRDLPGSTGGVSADPALMVLLYSLYAKTLRVERLQV